jgi:ABC-type Fe3+/spermidine/putrescine transport system ATPase subunit
MVMAHIRLTSIEKSYGSLQVLWGCSLAVEKGEIVTLLGPSGCGKTTLLRVVAGFTVPESGRVEIGGIDVTFARPNHRQVGYVFQNYALFPHLSVRENVAYGLRVRRLRRRDIAERVARALDLVSMSGFAGRYPVELSGGQQQRVAIARVLVLEPQVLLLDEPFNALDAKLRHAMQVELKKLIKRLGITSIFVTHDQDEALTVSDQIAVMRAGRIEQIAPPLTIYDRPASAYVANFIGRANIVVERAAAGSLRSVPGLVPPKPDGEVAIVVRPENLELRQGADEGRGWRGTVAFVTPLGATLDYEIDIGRDLPLRVVTMRRPGTAGLPVGAPVTVTVADPSACVLLAEAARDVD